MQNSINGSAFILNIIESDIDPNKLVENKSPIHWTLYNCKSELNEKINILENVIHHKKYIPIYSDFNDLMIYYMFIEIYEDDYELGDHDVYKPCIYRKIVDILKLYNFDFEHDELINTISIIIESKLTIKYQKKLLSVIVNNKTFCPNIFKAKNLEKIHRIITFEKIFDLIIFNPKFKIKDNFGPEQYYKILLALRKINFEHKINLTGIVLKMMELFYKMKILNLEIGNIYKINYIDLTDRIYSGNFSCVKDFLNRDLNGFWKITKNKIILYNDSNAPSKFKDRNKKSEIEKSEELIFEGELKNNMKNGTGTFYTAVGVYYGAFYEDKMCGHGTFKFHSGHVYQGNFNNNKIYGYGKVIYANGNIYKGELQDNKKHGYGKIKDTNGNEWEGEWENDKQTDKEKFGFFKNLVSGNDDPNKAHFPVCDICVKENHPKELKLCGCNNCREKVCQKCLHKMYNKTKGMYVNIYDIACMFCRRTLSTEMLLGFDKNLVKFLSRLDKNDKNKYGWCNLCKKFEKIEQECGDNNQETKFTCVLCQYKQNHTKRCPFCQIPVNRTGGCHHITCQCRKHWCWYCLKELKSEHEWNCMYCNE